MKIIDNLIYVMENIAVCAYIYPSALKIWILKKINKFKSTHLNTVYSLPQDINKASRSMKFFKKLRYVSE